MHEKLMCSGCGFIYSIQERFWKLLTIDLGYDIILVLVTNLITMFSLCCRYVLQNTSKLVPGLTEESVDK